MTEQPDSRRTPFRIERESSKPARVRGIWFVIKNDSRAIQGVAR